MWGVGQGWATMLSDLDFIPGQWGALAGSVSVPLALADAGDRWEGADPEPWGASKEAAGENPGGLNLHGARTMVLKVPMDICDVEQCYMLREGVSPQRRSPSGETA